MRYFIKICVLAHFFTILISNAQTLKIPEGSSIKIDGIMEKEEWLDAAEQEFIGGKTILLQRDSKFLYLGIRGEKGGFASVCVLRGDTIDVYHSSMGLITAKYVKENSKWVQVHEFRSEAQSRIGKLKNLEEKMELSIKEYGWFANTLQNGNTDEKEYIISLNNFRTNSISVSVVFFQHAGKIQFAHAPAGLSDGSMISDMVRGGNIKHLNFDPSTWMKIVW